MNKIILIATFLLLGNLYAQTPIGALDYGTIEQPKFIVFDERLPRSNNAQEILQANLNLNEHIQYQLNQQLTDKLGRLHQKYQQYYKGLKINGAEYIVHYSLDGTIGSINGNYYPIAQLNEITQLSESAALSYALSAINADEYLWNNAESEQWLKNETNDATATFYPEGELLIQPIAGSDAIDYKLAYQFNIVTSQPFSSFVVMIDAINGNIINKYTTFSSGAGDACTRYSDTVAISTALNTSTNNYELRDTIRGGGIVTKKVVGLQNNVTNNEEFKDTNDVISPNDWTCTEYANLDKDNAALDAHWAGMMTYDYFKQEHNRNSYDDLGGALNLFIHYRNSGGPNAAEWLGTSQPNLFIFGIALGDGDDSIYSPLVSLDIIAHEFAHGITQFSSGLLPDDPFNSSPESPSINEGLSDIWGAVVENWVLTNGFNGAGDTDKDIWLAGEEVRINRVAERSLRDPKGAGFDPLSSPIGAPMADTYGGDFYSGLRGKSGVMSHWFYLLSEGSLATDSINDSSFVFNFLGIGIEKAADIVYMAQTVYFTRLTDYRDARQATLQAAKDLYGSCSIEAIAVADAWDAVGVPIISLIYRQFTPPSTCGTIDRFGISTGVYDSTGFVNIVVGLPSDGGEIYSGIVTGCNSFNQILVPNGSKTVFKASDRILLENGFKAERGSNFKAYIFECASGNYRVGGNNNPEEEENTVIDKYENNNSVLIYPNPNRGLFNVEVKNLTGVAMVEVYDLMGKKMMSKVMSENEVVMDITTYPKGIYVVRVLEDKQAFINKIVYQ